MAREQAGEHFERSTDQGDIFTACGLTLRVGMGTAVGAGIGVGLGDAVVAGTSGLAVGVAMMISGGV